MFDRMFAIKRPMKYKRSLQSKKTVILSIVISWCFAVIPGIPLWFDTTLSNRYENKPIGADGCKCYFPLENVSIHISTKFPRCLTSCGAP